MEDTMMSEAANLSAVEADKTKSDAAQEPRNWPRAGLSLFFLVLFSVGQSLFFALALVQLVWFLVQRAPNPFLSRFGPSLGQWLGDASRFIYHDTEEKPFPFKAWPAIKSDA
jgi:hypothetical protein